VTSLFAMGRARSYTLITFMFVALGLVPASATTSQPPDAWLTAKAKIAVLGKVGTAGTSVHVDTVEGRVVLHGHVTSAENQQAAEKAVRDIEGVRDVRNLLQSRDPSQLAASETSSSLKSSIRRFRDRAACQAPPSPVPGTML
jgi:hypothetical protein